MEDLVKVEELNDIKKKISIQVCPENVDKKFTEFFKNVQKDAQIKGFRKGKVPVNTLKMYFGDKAKSSVSQMLMAEYYAKAVRENNINPVGQPTIDNLKADDKYAGSFNDDNSYSVNILVDVLPKLDPTGYENLELDIPVTDEASEYDKKLLAHREQFSERKQISDRGAQAGDSLVVDFKGYTDGVQFDGGSAEGFLINKLGSANFIPGFEDELVGMKVGESKTLKLKFPDQYGAKHLAGKDAEFEVKLHSIVENKLAEVNNDLAMMVGYQTVEEMESKIREEVKVETEEKKKQQMERAIVDKLKAVNTFSVPDSMVKNEQYKILQQAGLSEKQINASVLKSVEGLARYNVERSILVDAIYDKESSLEINPDELDKLLEEFSVKYQKTKDEFVSMLYNTKQMDSFIGVLRTKKVIDFIIKNAKSVNSEV